MSQHYNLRSLAQMCDFAHYCADRVKIGDVLLLNGDLGVGKTTFVRFFIARLMGNEVEVVSPTFTIMQPYETPKGMVWHADLYRLRHSQELWDIGIEEILGHAFLLVEWPNIVEFPWPEDRVELTFDFDPHDEDGRQVTCQSFGNCQLSGVFKA